MFTVQLGQFGGGVSQNLGKLQLLQLNNIKCILSLSLVNNSICCQSLTDAAQTFHRKSWLKVSVSKRLHMMHHNMIRIMRKPTFCKCENKDADQLRGNREADQHLCFRYLDSTILYFLNTKFQASSHLQWLYSLVCVRSGQNPHCWFSHVVAHMNMLYSH